MDQRLSLVTLGVADLDRARRFYAALGWQPTGPTDEVVFFQLSGIVLGLWGRDELARDSLAHDAGGWGGVTLAQNLGSPAAVDALLDEAASAGGTVRRRGAPTEWGGYSGLFADPDGHCWEVAHNPFWSVTDDGRTLLQGGEPAGSA